MELAVPIKDRNRDVMDALRQLTDEQLESIAYEKVIAALGKDISSEGYTELVAVRVECARRSSELYERTRQRAVADVHAQLNRIINSSYFTYTKKSREKQAVPRLTKPGEMLQYIVGRIFKDGRPQLREQEIGTAVFELRSEYDTSVDPIVRVQAGTLRKKLAAYYAAQGRADPIGIRVPRGVYVPTVNLRKTRSRAAQEPRLKVLPITGNIGSEAFSDSSPDGEKIVFCWNGPKEQHYGIYVKDISSGTLTRLTSSSADDLSPVWSPDGNVIAFLRVSARRSVILIIDADGSNEREVIDVYPVRFEILGRQLTWHPNSKALVISEKPTPQEPFSLYLQPLPRGNLQKLTSPPAASVGDSDPVLSSDGSALAFVRTSSVGIKDVYVMQRPEGTTKRVTRDSSYISGVAWSEGSTGLVFSSSRMGTPCLWSMRLTGREPQLLPGIGGDAVYPAISREGKRLTYTQMSINNDIWRASLDCSTAPCALIQSTRHDVSPQFSPDGNSIAFTSNRHGSLEIWTCRNDGSNPVELTKFRAPTGAGSPRWSPDGSQIIFDCRVNGKADIYAISAQGGSPARITPGAGENVVPSWSKTGWIYFASNRGGDWQIWRMRHPNGDAVQVTRDGGFAPVESPDGQYVIYSKGRTQAGVFRVPTAKGDEVQLVPAPPRGFWGYWAVVEDGIYFLDFERLNVSLLNVIPKAIVKFYSFATGSISRAIVVHNLRTTPYAGLAVSPDRRWLLYTQLNRPTSNIMLVEDFH